MNIAQLNCPACKNQYTQVNPPRFLTMCGHTFCHKCIKTLITKKKDKGFKIKCPIDKGCMEIDKPNPSLFPKNIVLIDFFNKNNGQFTSNQFLDVSIIEKNVNHVEKENFPSEEKLKNQISNLQKIQSENKGVCKQHKKVMDVYCLQDFQIICTDCALFSHHRSHEIKNLGQLLKLDSQKKNELSAILNLKKVTEEKFMSKEIQNQIFELLDKKKGLIEKEISQLFVQLRNMLDKKEMEIRQNLEAKSLFTAERMRKKMKLEKSAIQAYQVWEDEVRDIIQKREANSTENASKRLQNLIRNRYHSEKIKDGQEIIERMTQKQKQFIIFFEETLNSFTFSYNTDDLQLALDNLKVVCQTQTPKKQTPESLNFKNHIQSGSHYQFQNQNFEYQNQTSLCQNQIVSSQQFIPYQCQFSSYHLPFRQGQKKQKKQKNSFNRDEEEESLLDFDTSFDPKPLRPSVLSCNNISVSQGHCSTNQIKNKKEGGTQLKKKAEIDKKTESQKKLHKPRTLTMSLSSVSARSISSVQKPSSPMPKKTESRFKFQALIESISGNKVDIVDITGAQPKPEQLSLILQAIKISGSVKTVKLMRNKLEDSFIQKYLKCLLSVERLNLAQNKLTQNAVDEVIEILKDNPDHKIQSLNMGQNRIVERKNRKVLEEFKKLSVNIVL